MKDKQGLYPDEVGPYRIIGLIAEGGMSLVLAGEGPDGDAVAIKLAEVHDQRGRERFRREIEACRRLAHPGIIRIRAAGEHQGRPWYAMDHHGEVTLRELIECNGPGVANELPALIGAIQRREIFALPADRRRLLPRAAVVELVIAVGEAVAHAHERGLIHRDLKPENILLQPSGRPVVVDFGLVADLADGRRLTATSKVVGTVGYLAPEQFSDHHRADERVDVYATGVILRELLTGHGPDDDPRPRAATATFHTSTRLSRAAGDRPLDRELSLVLFRATHPDPRRRYRSMPAFLADLGRIQRGEPILARPDPLWQRVLDRLRRRGALVAGVLAVLAVISAVALVLVIDWRLRDLAWAPWTERHRLDRAAEVARLDAIAGSWRLQGDAIAPIGGLGALAAPGERGVRLRLRATFSVGADASGGGGLFAAAGRDHRDGYLLHLGAGTVRLERRGEPIAVARRRLEPGEHVLRWELDLDRHRVWLDGDELLVVRDQAPLPGGRCGLHAEGPGWRWHRFELRPEGVRGAGDAAAELHRLAGIAATLEPGARTALAPAVDEAIRRGEATPAVLVAGARARRVLAPGARPPAGTLLTRVDPERRDEAWRREALLAQWFQAEGPARLEALAQDWDRPRSRDALALWLPLAADELGDPAPLLAQRSWATAQAPGPLVAVATAAARHRRLRWEGAARLEELERQLAEPVAPWAPRAAAWAWWARRVGLAAPNAGAIAPEVELLAVLQRRAAAFEGHPSPEEPVAALVTGSDPAARFDPGLQRAGGPLAAAERRALAGLGRGVLADPALWDLVEETPAVVVTSLDRRLRGEDDWASVAAAAAAAGLVAWELPWHRLLLAALAVEDSTETRSGALQTLGETELDAFAGGLCYAVLTGAPIGPERVAATSGAVRPVVAALAAGGAPDPALQVPPWHPSRPILELALAVKARDAGDPVQAAQRLRRLAAQPAWPEGRAAQVLLERQSR